VGVLAADQRRQTPVSPIPATGREGLEPITPAQGGDIAWSLNLRHPYNPAGPCRQPRGRGAGVQTAIIAGATVTSASGAQDVEPGLESHGGGLPALHRLAGPGDPGGVPGGSARPR